MTRRDDTPGPVCAASCWWRRNDRRKATSAPKPTTSSRPSSQCPTASGQGVAQEGENMFSLLGVGCGAPGPGERACGCRVRRGWPRRSRAGSRGSRGGRPGAGRGPGVGGGQGGTEAGLVKEEEVQLRVPGFFESRPRRPRCGCQGWILLVAHGGVRASPLGPIRFRYRRTVRGLRWMSASATMSPVTQATGSPASRTRANCGLVEKGRRRPALLSPAGPGRPSGRGQVQLLVQQRVAAGPDIGQEDPHLAVADLAQRSAVRPRHPG